MSDYRDRVKACHDCGEDVEHTGKVKSIPAYIYPSKCKALIVIMHPEPEDYSRLQASILTGEMGKALHDALDFADIDGQPWIGYTSIIKCKLSSGRTKRRVAKICSEKFLKEELDLIKPQFIVLVGMPVVKHFLPDLAASSNIHILAGEPFLHLDQWYFVVRDLEALLISKNYKRQERRGEFIGLGLSFKKLKELIW